MGESRDHTKLPAKEKMACTEAALNEILAEQVQIYALSCDQIIHVLTKITSFWSKVAVGELPKKKRK